jgi:hypothetical protein
MTIVILIALAAPLLATLNAILSFTGGYDRTLSWMRVQLALLAWVAWLWIWKVMLILN